MDFEKLLGGNLGYGTIIIILSLIFFIYKMFIEPKLKETDSLQNQIDTKKDEIKKLTEDKDKVIEQLTATVESQQVTISNQQETILKQETTLNSIGKVETLETVILNLNKEIESITTKLRNSFGEVADIAGKNDRHLATLISAIGDLDGILESNFTEMEKRLSSVESLTREIINNRSSSLTQLGTNLANIESGLAQIRGMVASKFSEENGLGLQDIK